MAQQRYYGNGEPEAPPKQDNSAINLSVVERVLVQGDLSQFTEAQRIEYYLAVCKSVGLNPLTRPFEFFEMDVKKGNKREKVLKLYATRDCGDQLRKIYNISVTVAERKNEAGVYYVISQARMPDGRVDESIGAVAFAEPVGKYVKTGKRYDDGNEIIVFQRDGTMMPLAPLDAANAMMKAETKSKRRVALSICGLGMLDETEVEDIREASARHMGLSPDIEAEADRAAEEDPSLTIKPKQIAAVPADQVINTNTTVPKPEPVPVQQKATPKSSTLHFHAPANTPSGAVSMAADSNDQDDPLAGLPKDKPTVDPVVAAQNAFVERQMKVAAQWGLEREKIAPFIVALKGPTKELPPIERPPIWNSALDSLEIALKEGGASAVDAFRAHPSAFGESLREKAVKPVAESAAGPDPLAEAFPKWSAEAVAIAKKIKGNAAMGGFLAKLKAMGFQQLESADALAALNLYKVSQNAVLIAANVGKRHSEVWPVFAKHWERLDPDAQETIKATTAELRGATA